MLFPLAVALLQPPVLAYSTPPDGDTTGYWQQRASYTIVARLDETTSVLHATGTLVYVNRSPDTLRELYVHQYLNAFRPASAWSAVDEREGRERFQHLRDPDYAYERFTEAPIIDGVPVTPEYPGAPDSTVVRLRLPRPLAPGDTTWVQFAWDARLSTTPRRQGRRGRSYDFAQWYPKVAVYDRDGWEANPLRPAGEFYGEFGDFDVTLLLREDQVIGTTGVVVEGDPGWRGALRWGVVARQTDAYGALPPGPAVDTPPGYKRLRIVAHDVHHFAWSISPDYRYEGGYYLRPDSTGPTRFRTWDSVAVHVLYRPGDAETWGQGQAVARTNVALAWLESIYGPYAYPQMTVLHRIEGGGTEFPMMQMDGSASQGLILHEGGHVFSYGILANNEWRAGWMDEGLTSFQTAWAQGMAPPERARQRVERPVERPDGYAGLAVRPDPAKLALVAQARLDLTGRTEPLATPAHEYRDFGIYNAMVYGRGQAMYDALRDALGDEAFRRFLHIYYARWALRHVDELAMKRAAEDASGEELDWFFAQWIHDTGVVDYALRDVTVRRDGDGWVTSGRVVRQGDYRHPMPLGVRVDTGWVLVRGQPLPDEQWLSVRTATRPLDVALDPLRTTPDWYVPNNRDVRLSRLSPRTARLALDWPFLDQSLADRYLTLVAPLAWYGRTGGATPAGRVRTSYLDLFDRHEVGIAVATRLRPAAAPPPRPWGLSAPHDHSRLQGWLVQENPKLWGAGRPLMGFRAGVWRLDGVVKAELSQRWDRSTLPSYGDRQTHTLALTGTYPYERAILDGRRWSGRSATDLTWSYVRAPMGASGSTWRIALTGGAAAGSDSTGSPDTEPYGRAEASWAYANRERDRYVAHYVRLYAGLASQTPAERGLYLSAATPTATFENHFWRPDGGLFSADDVPFRPLGGGGLRGYDPLVRARALVALNLEEAVRVARFGPAARPLDLDLTLFGDAGLRHADEPDGGRSTRVVGDAGLGLALRGTVFDRTVRVRLDLPFYVHDPALAVGTRDRTDAAGDHEVRLRWAFSFADLW
ncbi:MAG TPA: M1 family metallopeptidase [Gemmatimonadaceae bacterium]|nr:M1 family metallopeptidase [Gemmatimonadaceae bacterium]